MSTIASSAFVGSVPGRIPTTFGERSVRRAMVNVARRRSRRSKEGSGRPALPAAMRESASCPLPASTVLSAPARSESVTNPEPDTGVTADVDAGGVGVPPRPE